MVQKKTDTREAPRPRGRPRAFEADTALDKAMQVFRNGGFAATSLDDLSAAMGINRPSLYGAFGDKRQLFLKAYERYRAQVGELFAPAFDPALPMRAMLERVFATAVDLYLKGEDGPLGCFTVMTAGSEAMADPEIREIVQRGVQWSDAAFAGRFEVAAARGELPPYADCAALARVATATIHTLAIRARARVPRAELEAIVQGTIDLICSSTITTVRQHIPHDHPGHP